jgi:hypothetical protein
MTRRNGLVLAAGALIAMGAGSAGVAAPAPVGDSAILKPLLDCRALADPAARLACFDTAAGGLRQAQAQGDIVVVDKDQMRTARRQAFGLTLPSLAMFSRGVSDAELDTLTAVVQSAGHGPDGRWVIALEGGAVWRQIDDAPMARSPKAGSRADIRKGALGSFFMNLDGQRAIRVHRSE